MGRGYELREGQRDERVALPPRVKYLLTPHMSSCLVVVKLYYVCVCDIYA